MKLYLASAVTQLIRWDHIWSLCETLVLTGQSEVRMAGIPTGPSDRLINPLLQTITLLFNLTSSLFSAKSWDFFEHHASVYWSYCDRLKAGALQSIYQRYWCLTYLQQEHLDSIPALLQPTHWPDFTWRDTQTQRCAVIIRFLLQTINTIQKNIYLSSILDSKIKSTRFKRFRRLRSPAFNSVHDGSVRCFTEDHFIKIVCDALSYIINNAAVTAGILH